MANKLKVGLIGGTGMVGQRFALLLEDHPYFEVTNIAASPRSAGKKYGDIMQTRWMLEKSVPESMKDIVVSDASDIDKMKGVDFVFCAVDMDKATIKKLEEDYAKAEIPVVSNNSANRGTKDVPMLIPEVNDNHTDIIAAQRKRLGTKRGFIAVKPNCSIQTYVPALEPLMEFEPTLVLACTYQAISGAGKTFDTWPEMVDNVIPYIGGEEEKSEQEPLKIWGEVREDGIYPTDKISITTQCIRVAASDGHMAATFVKFKNKPSIEEIKKRWAEYKGAPQLLELPSAPEQFLTYYEEDNMPQTKLCRDLYNGMGVSLGRLRKDSQYDYKFIALSHNTLRGAAGGALLSAELLYKKGFFDK